MTGLSVLYAKQAMEERDWAEVPDRDKTSRLREVYWARLMESEFGHKSTFRMSLHWRPDRGELGRRADLPGDGFIYTVDMSADAEDIFKWIEVTEIFTTTPPSQIEGAMKAWNAIPNRHPVDFNEFKRGLRRGRPSRVEQRKAADKVIAQTERKLKKASYQELMEKYGYGTLVVGLPLWFAVPPEDPWRAENALDDFYTRTHLGLEELKRKRLKRRDCPFQQIVVTWDTSSEALKEWNRKKSGEYEDAANASLDNPIPAAKLWFVLSDTLTEGSSDLGIPESETPSMSFKIGVKTRKKKSGNGPYPEIVTVLGKSFREQKKKEPDRKGDKLRLWAVLTLCKLLCFVRLHGFGGLERWVARKLSMSRAWKARATGRRTRILYRESRRRSEARSANSGNV